MILFVCISLLLQSITSENLDYNEDKIKFYLWNKTIIEQEIHLNDYGVMTKAPIKFLIHGWQDSGTGRTFFFYGPFVQKYILTGANVVCVDWSYYSKQLYGKAAKTLKLTGNLVARMILDMCNKKLLELSQVHVIGHSMGAQTAGFVGKNIQKLTNGQKLHRITGLDPAGPMFHSQSEYDHLVKTDALLVDTVVTDLLQYGKKYPPLGQVNFYIYCGLNESTIVLNHNMAPFYFALGIDRNDLIGKECKCKASKLQVDTCKEEPVNILGENTNFRKPGNYYLNIDQKYALEDAQCSMENAPPSRFQPDFNIIKGIINAKYGIFRKCNLN
ncbi:phospholipase A1-like [Onthophagus taurus]|uniref:phospholipase A1-like n=1 Tax=Onthophagus taurus TaxID=166361 RepID=UPI0039BE6174